MRWRGILFGVICGFWLICLIPGVWLAAMASSADVEELGGVVLVGILTTLPLALLLAPIAGLIARSKGRLALAWWLAAAPLTWVVGAYALAAYALPSPS